MVCTAMCLLIALEMVTTSSEGAGSGEVVFQGLTLKNLIMEPQFKPLCRQWYF